MTRDELLKTAKPILFNTDMVRAILDGRKTVTRRCVKPKSKNAYGFYVLTNKSDGSFAGVYDYDEDENAFDKPQKQPAYKGDILYVRETWGRYSVCEGVVPDIYYKAVGNAPDKIKWIPSIHMPKEAARIFLRVTDVRVERVQDIITGDYRTPGNINKEGLYKPCIDCTHHNGNCKDFIREQTCRLVHSFAALWNSTIRKSGIETYCWAANPWVWVIEFERVEVQK